MRTIHASPRGKVNPFWFRFRALLRRWFKGGGPVGLAARGEEGAQGRRPRSRNSSRRCSLSVWQLESRESPTDALGVALGSAGLAVVGASKDTSVLVRPAATVVQGQSRLAAASEHESFTGYQTNVFNKPPTATTHQDYTPPVSPGDSRSFTGPLAKQHDAPNPPFVAQLFSDNLGMLTLTEDPMRDVFQSADSAPTPRTSALDFAEEGVARGRGIEGNSAASTGRLAGDVSAPTSPVVTPIGDQAWLHDQALLEAVVVQGGGRGATVPGNAVPGETSVPGSASSLGTVGNVLNQAVRNASLPSSELNVPTDTVAPALQPYIYPPSAPNHDMVVENFGRLPMQFEANQGQTDKQVRFLSRGPGYSIFLTPTEAVLALQKPAVAGAAENGPDRQPAESAVLRMQFVGANPKARLVGVEQLPGTTNYLIGNDPRNWHTDIPNFSRVVYQELYSGVDLVFYGRQQELEYDLIVAPGADVGAIRFSYTGADNLRVDDRGNLIVSTSGGEVVQHAPVVYQETDGVRQTIQGRYLLYGEDQIGFMVETYDVSKPLVIDPVLSYSSYLGGSGNSDEGRDVAVDSAGNAYITGQTNSLAFPGPTPTVLGSQGALDVFVTKVSADGSQVLFTTFIGGTFDDVGDGIAVDSAGNAYVTGRTRSSGFPTAVPIMVGGYSGASLHGNEDAFVLKLNAAGNALVYSSFVGGSGGADIEFGRAIVVNSSGDAFVVGQTSSTSGFPTLNPYQATSGGGNDAFLLRLDTNGALIYSSYLGGLGSDVGRGIALDSSGNTVYVIGTTASTDFPVSSGVLQGTNAGGDDVFAAKFTITGTGATRGYATYLGGTGNDNGWDITVDSSTGNAYLTGDTVSSNFPTVYALQPTIGGGTDAFLAQLSATGTTLLYSTFLGGSGTDQSLRMARDASGRIYLTGRTESTNFPVTNAFQATNMGSGDAFVTVFQPGGCGLVYSTYLGGTGSDTGNALALDPANNVYVTGVTASNTGFPLLNPFQSALNGTNDAFITKLRALPGDVYSNSEPAFGDYGDPQDTGGSATGVYVHNGEFHTRVTDLAIPGRGLSWSFTRSYRSGVQFDSPLGQNWDFTDNRRLRVVNSLNLAEIRQTFPTAQLNDVVRLDGLNRADLYVRQGDGSYTSPRGFFTRLTLNADSTFSERDASGMVYSYLVPDTRGLARIARITDPNGNALRYVYTPSGRATSPAGVGTTALTDSTQAWVTDQWKGLTVQIVSGAGAGQSRKITANTSGTLTVDQPWTTALNTTSEYAILNPSGESCRLFHIYDSMGRRINFSYDSVGRLTQVRDFFGRSLTFTYNANGDLVTATGPAVTGTPNGNDFPNGKTTQYTYSSGFGTSQARLNHNLLTITAPNEFAVSGPPRVTVAYNQTAGSLNMDRVVSQTIGGTNGSNILAGGSIGYSYVNLNTVPTPIDDGDVPGFSATGGFSSSTGQGYQNDVRFAVAGTGSETATWTFSSLTPGTYRVAGTWSAHPNRATNAPFSVYNGTAIPANLLGTVNVNQRLAPDDFDDLGGSWENLGGSYTITGTTLTVQLTDNANGYVIADAIRIERIPAPTDFATAVFKTTATDRKGNVTEYQVNQLGNIVLTKEFTPTMNPRMGQPASFDTTYTYNGDYLLTGQTLPEGNFVTYTYSTGDRFQQGNLVSVLRSPGPRGGDQTFIQTTSVFEPIFNQVRKQTDPRGNDATFRPPIALPGETYPNAARYTTTSYFDYQESAEKASASTDPSVNQSLLITYDLNVLTTEVRLVRILGLPETTAGIGLVELRNRLSANGVALGLGDLNGDGSTTPTVAGNVIRVESPTVRLLPGSNQAAVEGQVLLNGKSTANGTSTTLVDGTQNWSPGQWVGQAVEIIRGTGAGQVRYITANTATQLTVGTAWTTNPDSSSSYAILPIPANQLGTATAPFTPSTTLNDSSKTWVSNQWTGRLVEIISGTGVGQVRTIQSNTPTQLTVNMSWTIDGTSRYAILPTSLLQYVTERMTYNQFGQMTSRTDPEQNVDTYIYFAEQDPNGDGTIDNAAANATTGGYLKEAARDTTSAVGRNSNTNPAPTNLRRQYRYDAVGNVTREIDGRGIATDYVVNQLNQVVQVTRAAASGLLTLDQPEPITLTNFQYLERTFFDYNNNVVLRQVEDRGNTSGVDGNLPSGDLPTGVPGGSNPDALGGTAYVDTVYKYDILDNQVEMIQEVQQTPTQLVLRTRYRYDRNQNQVLTILPEGNASSSVYDERDLLFQSTSGVPDNGRPLAGLYAPGDPTTFNRPGGTGTTPSIRTYNYDRNRNLIETVDAEMNGGTTSTIAGVGDVTRTTFDGFDRTRTVTDALGNVSTTTYDAASNVIRVIQVGDPVNDIAGNSENKTLAVTEYVYDELSRRIVTHQVLFRTPDAAPTRTPVLTDSLEMDALAAYLPLSLTQAGSDTDVVPDRTDITVLGRVSSLTEYDRNSRVTFTVQDDLDTYRTFYDGASRVSKTTDSVLNNGFSRGAFTPSLLAGNTAETAYDDNSNPVERKEIDVTTIPGVASEVFRTTSIYDSLNRLQTTSDNRGQTTDYRYDSRNNLVAKADAVGPVGTRTLDRRGLADTVLPSAPVYILDDGDPGFSTTVDEDGWTPVAGQGYQNDVLSSAAGVQSDTATWTFSNLAPGLYRVAVTWTAGSLQATDAPYTIYDGPAGTGTALGTVAVNQRLAPGDFSDAGVTWKDLGATYRITATTLAVRLSDHANGPVIADAVRIQRVGDLPLVVDDGGAGFATSGSWTNSSGQGYQNDVTFAAAGTGANTATWTFTVTPGTYRVSATWFPDPNRATNSPFTVFDGTTGGTNLGTVLVNQELAPNDFSEGGAAWENLGGSYIITGTTLTVRLTDQANDYVIADAVRVQRLGDLPPLQIKDDGDAGFTTAGSGWSSTAGQGYQNDVTFHAAGTGANTATWAFAVTPGLYQVAVTWFPDPNRATNAPFTVLDGSTSLGTVLVNQELTPGDFSDAGVGWKILNTYNISGTTLNVRLTDNANDYVVADGVRIEKVTRVTVNDFGNVTRFYYDGLSRRVESETLLTTTGQGNGTFIGATLEGVKETIPGGYLDTSNAGDGLISSYFAYDDNSQLLARRDDNGNTTAYIYDNQNRTKIERRGLNITGTTFTISGGDSGAFNVGLRGGVVVQDTEPNTDISYDSYDRDSNVLSRRDEAGNVFNCTFDALNRQKTCSIIPTTGFIGTTALSWEFDGLSRQTVSTDNNDTGGADDVTTQVFYDSLSRKVEETQKIGTLPVRATSFNYDIATSGAVYQVSATIYPDGRQVHSTYDTLDRLISRRDNGASSVGTYQYLGSGRVAVLTYQNNTRLTHLAGTADAGFDDLRRVVNHRWESFTPGVTALGAGTRVVEFGHKEASGAAAYDRANNKKIEEKLHDSGNSEVYTYQSDYQLRSFNRGTLNTAKTAVQTPTTTAGALQAQTWALDGLGNWTANTHTTGGTASTENRTVSDYNEIVTVSGTPYGGAAASTHVLDRNGNLTNDGVRLYEYDALNRLRRVKKVAGSVLIGEYSYDAGNRRMRSVVSNNGLDGTATNGTTDFYYDGWRVVEEHDTADAITQQYVYGNELDEVWTLDNRRGGITVPQLNDVAGSQRHFYHSNTLGSVYGLTDETAALKEAYQYDAYGRQTVINDGNDADMVVNFNTNDVRAVGGASAINNPYLFTGQRLDAETKLDYYKNRYYSTDLGRFIQRDLDGYTAGDSNLYRYVGNGPTNATDPSGLQTSQNPIDDKKKTIQQLEDMKRKREEGFLKVLNSVDGANAGIPPDTVSRLSVATLPQSLNTPTKGKQLTIVVKHPDEKGNLQPVPWDKLFVKIWVVDKYYKWEKGNQRGDFIIMLEKDFPPINPEQGVLNPGGDNPRDNGLPIFVTYKVKAVHWGYVHVPIYEGKKKDK